jgi:putative FmdB family regulatory protein
MPIYEYECTQCRCHFDKKQGFHDAPVATCPECQGKVQRVITPIPTVFKGGGFYVTDHRKDMDRAKDLQWDKETGKLKTLDQINKGKL